MRIRYHELVGKRVVTSDGHNIGRISDLSAEPRDGKLYVTGLLVGPTALFRRIAFKIKVDRVPWRLVDQVGDRVRLRVSLDELRKARDGS